MNAGHDKVRRKIFFFQIFFLLLTYAFQTFIYVLILIKVCFYNFQRFIITVFLSVNISYPFQLFAYIIFFIIFFFHFFYCLHMLSRLLFMF